MKILKLFALLMLVAGAAAVSIFEWETRSVTSDVGPTAQAEAAAVYRARYLLWIDDEPWNEAAWGCYDRIKSLPQGARFDFYRTVMISRDLDGGHALHLAEDIKQDAEAFRAYLLEYAKTPGFRGLREWQRREVRSWTEEMTRITDAQAPHAEPKTR